MAEQQSENRDNKSKSGNRKRGRRRYFRRKKSNQADAPSKESAQQGAKPDAKQTKERRSKRADSSESKSGSGRSRRRKRTRTRSNRETQSRSRKTIMQEIDESYKAPEAVFIYTHVLRPDSRDSYEFRSDHFANITRKLDDFRIDLSPVLDRPPKLEPGVMAQALLDQFGEDGWGESDEDVANAVREDAPEATTTEASQSAPEGTESATPDAASSAPEDDGPAR